MAKQANFGKNTLKAETKKKGSPRKKKKSGFNLVKSFSDEKTGTIFGLFLIVFSLYILLAFISYLLHWKVDDNLANSLSDIFSGESTAKNHAGKLGHALSFLFIKECFGIASFLIPLNLFVIGSWMVVKVKMMPIGRMIRISLFLLLWLSICMAFIFQSEHLGVLGGFFGLRANQWFTGIFGMVGTGILLFFAFVAFLVIAYNLSLKWLKGIGNIKIAPTIPKKEIKEETETDNPPPTENNLTDTTTKPVELTGEKKPEDNPAIELLIKKEGDVEESVKEEPEFTIENPVGDNGKINGDDDENDDNGHQGLDTAYDPRLDLPHYKFPPLDYLPQYETSEISVTQEELEENKNRIVSTLENYGILIDKIKATVGPTITLYEIIPAPGIRISKIKNLSDDIALSLSAIGIRIIAPLPGKGTIGIEVPNKNPEVVSIRSILSSDRFQKSKYELPIGLGKTISNESFIADLTKMPHLLVAGATGQGKSVGLNAIITSLLYSKHPSELKFVMVDPKKVELTLFSKIERHFLAKLPDAEEAIITDTKQVVRTLNSLNILMEKRYNLLNSAEVRNVKEYNKKFVSRQLNPENGHEYLPYIVVIIDEFADLIMTAGKEVEMPLTRLAQLARAIGIHLVIATQRPSTNIITGTIKANFPARMAFRVISSIDSRTILDSIGANQLIGRGDMLLSTGSELLRLQCAYVDTPEVGKVTSFIGEQRAYPTAYNLPEFVGEDDETNKDFNPDDRDELFEDAARIIVQHQHGSTSLLQRKLKLGYNRAGRIIDQLEAAGIVGPFEGSKAREVKYRDELSLEQFLKGN